MEVRHLATFQAACRAGSFLGAAQALKLSQPTVTLHVQELEAELGCALFDRSGRRRHLTPAGELFAARGLSILDGLAGLRREIGELLAGNGGQLAVGAIEPLASRRLVPLLGRLATARPALRILLAVSGTGGVSRAVADGELDCGICSAPAVELGLRYEPLFAEELAVLVPANHRLARSARLAAADLDQQPLLLTEQGCAYRRVLELAFQERGVRMHCRFESGSTATLLAAVNRGLGIAVLPRQAVQPTPGRTRVRRLWDLPLSLPVGLVTRTDSPQPPAALARFLEVVRRDLRTTTS
jgi:LysR family transcriptional regulator, regulator of the ytmI operon